MRKELINEMEKKLEEEKMIIEKELEKFAKKDEKLKEDWDTRFPHWDGESGSSALEREADEVEEYSTLLPIEHSFETKLRDVNSALEKIKKGAYGKCEKCGQEIGEDKLRIVPETKLCAKCQNK